MKHLFIKYFSATALGIFIVALILLAMSASSCNKDNNCYTCQVKTTTGNVLGHTKDSFVSEYKCGMTARQIERYEFANSYQNVSSTGEVSSKQTLCVKQ